MEIEASSWKDELDNMLSAFHRQAAQSLGIIKNAFKRNGLSFTPGFKQRFLQLSNNRIKETYDQFEMEIFLDEQLNVNVISGAIMSNGSLCDNEYLVNSIPLPNHVIDVASDQMNKPSQVDTVAEIEHSERSEVKSAAHDSASGSINRARSVGSSVNTIILSDDSDNEETTAQIHKMKSTDVRATENAASASNTAMNQTKNQEGEDKVKIGIKNEGDIKPKKDKVDDDIRMIEIQVNRKVRVLIDEEDTLAHASSSTFTTTNGNRSTINSAHVKRELENQTLINLIEIDDSSDEEGATETAHTSNVSMQKATSQMGSLVDLSNAPSQVGRLGQSNISSTLAERANDINAFHIGSTVIQSSESTARTGTSGKERCRGPDVVGIVVNAPVDSNNDDAANSIRSTNTMVVEGQKGKMNESRSRSGNNEGIDESKENQRRITNAHATDKRRHTNKATMLASNLQPATEQSKTNRFKCRHCEYVSRQIGNLNRHMRVHTGEKPYRCDRCGKRFASEQNMKRHALTHTAVFPFHCKGCLRGFSRKVEKEAHVKECKARQYECYLCKKFVTSVKTLMKTHMRTHTGEKPYRCDRCGKRFASEQNMKRHALTHTAVFPFHCKGCLRGFSRKVEKEAHLKECKARQYECHLCKKFVTFGKKHLERHMRKHTGEKPFRCEICLTNFSVKCNLKTHLNNIHTRINR